MNETTVCTENTDLKEDCKNDDDYIHYQKRCDIISVFMTRLITHDIKAVEMYYIDSQKMFRNYPHLLMLSASDLISYFDMNGNAKYIQSFIIDILRIIHKLFHGDSERGMIFQDQKKQSDKDHQTLHKYLLENSKSSLDIVQRELIMKSIVSRLFDFVNRLLIN